MTRMGRSIVTGSLFLAIAAGSREAAAAGFATQRFGGEQGSVVSTNPTALYYNPAGIGFSEGIHLYLDGDIALRHATWSHVAPQPGPSDPTDSQVGNSGDARLLNVFGAPALAATMKIGNLAIGAGLFVPFGGRVNWATANNSNPNYPLTEGGVQRWHMTDAALTFIQVSAGVAYRLGPLSIGATGNFVNSQVTLDEARTEAGNIDSTSEGRARLDVAGNNGSFAVGAMLEAVRNRLWIGFSYQAQPGMGPQTLKGTFNFTNGPAPYYAQNGNLNDPVDFHQSLPDIYRAGVRFKATDDVELRLFGDYTRWSVMKAQCINLQSGGDSCVVYPDGTDATPMQSVIANVPRNWRNTFGARVGGSYWVKPEVELFAGLGYETGAEPDATLEPGAMDADNVAIALGGRLLVANYFYLAASYTHLQFLTRDVTDSTLSTINGKAVSLPTLQQDGNGQYTQWIGIFDVNVEKQF
jgi:long-chain fatty acid transport protein